MIKVLPHTAEGAFSGCGWKHGPWLMIKAEIKFCVMPWHVSGAYSYVLLSDIQRMEEHLNCQDFRPFNNYSWLDEYYDDDFPKLSIRRGKWPSWTSPPWWGGEKIIWINKWIYTPEYQI